MKQEYNYIPLREPIPITEQVWPEGTIPLVSTLTTAYNHEIFIHECIEGFLMQKTIFPVEIIIHDDASTDRTTEIIKEYKIKNPTLFKTIFQSENQYSQKVDIYNEFLYPKTQGKYIALCEGDDYWIDPYKLQKQVDFLEANPEYGLVYGKARSYVQEQNKFGKIIGSNADGFDDLLLRNTVPTLTTMFRNDLLIGYRAEIEEQRWIIGDYPIWLYISCKSKIHFMDEVVAVYRILLNSLSSRADFDKREKFILSEYEIREYFIKKYSAVDYKSFLNNLYRDLFENAFVFRRKKIALEYFKNIHKTDFNLYLKVLYLKIFFN